MTTAPAPDGLDVSIVMPCLNEVQSLEVCIRAAQSALKTLENKLGLTGEVVIADNGSTDGSQALSERLGARVVAVQDRGYGAALQGGFNAARGRFLVMGDADGSYNFAECVPMIEQLMAGADLCMGSRFRGGIAKGAMPWKNRYIGNPVLTGILNLLFRTGTTDAHCGLRALTREHFKELRLSGAGMEFASEMVIKSSLLGARIAETPATLSPDLRDRPPHLRPWRDGWRHLRYLLMLSPLWLYAVPAMFGLGAGLAILGLAGVMEFTRPNVDFFFGNYWQVLAGALVSVSHLGLFLGLATQVYGTREGYRRPNALISSLSRWLSLETMLIAGVVLGLAGMAILAAVLFKWTASGFAGTRSVYPAVVGTLCLTLGVQNVMGGFLMAILGGNQARFLDLPQRVEHRGFDGVAKTKAA